MGDAIRCIQSDGVIQLGGGAGTADLKPGQIYYVKLLVEQQVLKINTLKNADGTAVTVTTASGTDLLLKRSKKL